MKILVIGAGAAGLAAARQLHDDGHDVTVLEARDRIGGRAFSSYDVAAHPVELGAEYIHGQNVHTWSYVERFGLGTIDIHDQLRMQVFDGTLWDESFLTQPNALLPFKMPFAAAAWMAGGGTDMTLADAAPQMPGFLDEELTDSKREYWNAFVCQFNCGDIDHVGVGGLAEATHEGDGDKILFRLTDGYSNLMGHLADGLDIRLNTPVREIRWSRDGVEVDGIAADRAIVTLPLAVLQAGDVTFAPGLPADKLAAVNGLRHGPAAKVVLRFARPVWPDGMSVLIATNDSQNWWRSGAGRDNEDGVLTSLICGPAVERMRATGDPAKEGLRLLEEIFGRSLGDDLVESHFIDWGADPWAKMGYSYVPPGGVGLRDGLAVPVGDVLHFAGEATSRLRPQTVHGAFESGLRAAAEIAEC